MIFEAAMQLGRSPAVADMASRLARRDPGALASMVDQYQHRLYRYLLRFVHDSARAEDLFQQTWLRVVQSIHRYDGVRSFEAWLFWVAHNLAIDYLRRRQPESLDEPAEEDLPRRDRLAAGEPDALAALLTAERSGLLAAAIGELPAIHREILTLRFEEEMKLEEIADVIRIPLSTVKSRLRRALEGLREVIERKSRNGEWA